MNNWIRCKRKCEKSAIWLWHSCHINCHSVENKSCIPNYKFILYASLKKKELLDFIVSLISNSWYNKVKYKYLIMFVYFEVIRMDPDINISDELCLYKVTVANAQVENNSTTHILNNQNISRSTRKYSVGELVCTWVGSSPSIKWIIKY